MILINFIKYFFIQNSFLNTNWDRVKIYEEIPGQFASFWGKPCIPEYTFVHISKLDKCIFSPITFLASIFLPFVFFRSKSFSGLNKSLDLRKPESDSSSMDDNSHAYVVGQYMVLFERSSFVVGRMC